LIDRGRARPLEKERYLIESGGSQPDLISNEDRRKIEIGIKMQSLQALLPYLNEFHRLAAGMRQQALEEIKLLEEERETIAQGQLVFDDTSF